MSLKVQWNDKGSRSFTNRDRCHYFNLQERVDSPSIYAYALSAKHVGNESKPGIKARIRNLKLGPKFFFFVSKEFGKRFVFTRNVVKLLTHVENKTSQFEIVVSRQSTLEYAI